MVTGYLVEMWLRTWRLAAGGAGWNPALHPGRSARVLLEDVEHRDVSFPEGTLVVACAASARPKVSPVAGAYAHLLPRRAALVMLDLLRAVFPSGSVTGAPKIRTAQIIAELEPSPRGVYTGAIGFISPGESVFSVAIRTLGDPGPLEAERGAHVPYSDPRRALPRPVFLPEYTTRAPVEARTAVGSKWIACS